jgi:hypothetical protein
MQGGLCTSAAHFVQSDTLHAQSAARASDGCAIDVFTCVSAARSRSTVRPSPEGLTVSDRVGEPGAKTRHRRHRRTGDSQQATIAAHHERLLREADDSDVDSLRHAGHDLGRRAPVGTTPARKASFLQHGTGPLHLQNHRDLEEPLPDLEEPLPDLGGSVFCPRDLHFDSVTFAMR